MTRRHEAFRLQLNRFGFPPEYTNAWYTGSDDDLTVIRFTPVIVRNQTPGPGAGNVLDLPKGVANVIAVRN